MKKIPNLTLKSFLEDPMYLYVTQSVDTYKLIFVYSNKYMFVHIGGGDKIGHHKIGMSA